MIGEPCPHNLGRASRFNGGKEKDIFPLEFGKAAAVSKTGDLRRVVTEVATLRKLAAHPVPTISVSPVMMFQIGEPVSPRFIVDWIAGAIDSNSDPHGFVSSLRRLRPEQRAKAHSDLNKIEDYIRRYGGIMDLQLLLESSGALHVLDPRGEIEETSGSFQMIKRWRAALH